MVDKIIFKIVAVVRGWKVNLDSNIRVSFLYQFKRWHKVTVCTYKCDGICSIRQAIFNHSNRDVDICLFLFGAGNVTFAIRATNVFFQILATNNFKTVAVYQAVGIKECTLSTTFVGVKRTRCEINHLYKFLAFSEETLTKAHHVNPVAFTPYLIGVFRTADTIIEVKAVNIECYSFFVHFNLIKKPLKSGSYLYTKVERCISFS